MNTMKTNTCQCSSQEQIVLSCSGACDLGHLTDLVARRLRDQGIRKMNCLAVIGAGIEASVREFKQKDILVLDGCPVDCGKKILDKAGITHYTSLRMTDFGYIKGQTPVTEEIIQAVYEKASGC